MIAVGHGDALRASPVLLPAAGPVPTLFLESKNGKSLNRPGRSARETENLGLAAGNALTTKVMGMTDPLSEDYWCGPLCVL